MVAHLMRQPLLISSLLAHAERHHGTREIVSRLAEGPLHRCSYRELAARARRLANALAGHGVRAAERVASLAWNSHRHLELCHAVAGSGAVLHTLAPDAGPEQVVWMLRHAEDRMLFFDLGLLPVVEAAMTHGLPLVPLVVMTDRAHMPVARDGARLLCYEDLVAAHSASYDWPQLDEDTASSLCHVQGDDGVPRGVLHSHRSTMLQAYAALQPDAFGCSSSDVVLPVVPMSHGNAWGLPHAACMVGAKLVFAGPWLAGSSLCQLVEDERVSVAAALPAAWESLLIHLGERGLDLGPLRRLIVGGLPPGGRLLHAWAPTGTGVAGTVCVLGPGQLALGPDRRLVIRPPPGQAMYGIEMKIVGDSGDELPRDGVARGDLMVRGPWVAAGPFRGGGAEGSTWPDGWCPTGETAAIDPQGGVHLFGAAEESTPP